MQHRRTPIEEEVEASASSVGAIVSAAAASSNHGGHPPQPPNAQPQPPPPPTSESVHSSVSSMVPPSVRIEGCTPPSDSSVDGEMYKCELRSFSLDRVFFSPLPLHYIRGVQLGGLAFPWLMTLVSRTKSAFPLECPQMKVLSGVKESSRKCQTDFFIISILPFPTDVMFCERSSTREYDSTKTCFEGEMEQLGSTISTLPKRATCGWPI